MLVSGGNKKIIFVDRLIDFLMISSKLGEKSFKVIPLELLA
jgi:hypothetical protein